jgi:hypothetical protein
MHFEERGKHPFKIGYIFCGWQLNINIFHSIIGMLNTIMKKELFCYSSKKETAFLEILKFLEAFQGAGLPKVSVTFPSFITHLDQCFSLF